ncbi:hydrogenase maturation protease [Aetokthonos hydrillicola]|jgi:hydrogenase maturation protease|nr:hydrogenase maturation protease [Aetokthonos hydrillicola CCALA 1050]
MGSVIVIGYGNDLRSDDAIGQRVANTLALPNVKSLAVHQLTPELAQTLASADLAIFIDACIIAYDSEVKVRSLAPASSTVRTGHTGDPSSLLALTKAIYGHCPQAWWITVPGVNFEVGDRLSPIAETGVAIALEKIAQIVDESATTHATVSERNSRKCF